MFNRFFTCVNIGTYNNYSPMGGNCVDDGASLSLVPTADYIFAGSIWLPRDFLLKQYGVMVDTVTTSGRNMAYGIYRDSKVLSDDVRYPGTKIDQNNHTNITTTGFYSKTLSTPILLKGNRLYWAVLASDATGSINVKNSAAIVNILGFQFGDTTYPLVSKRGYELLWTYSSTLQTPFPSGATDRRFVPTLYMREPNQNGS
jgi:hypothetical protein